MKRARLSYNNHSHPSCRYCDRWVGTFNGLAEPAIAVVSQEQSDLICISGDWSCESCFMPQDCSKTLFRILGFSATWFTTFVWRACNSAFTGNSKLYETEGFIRYTSSCPLFSSPTLPTLGKLLWCRLMSFTQRNEWQSVTSSHHVLSKTAQCGIPIKFGRLHAHQIHFFSNACLHL